MGDGVRRVWRWWDALALIAGATGARPPEADLSVRVTRAEAEAEWRWSKTNEENRRKGCPCGGPAQVARPHAEVVGTVPYLWWTCEDHAGALMFVSSTIGGQTVNVPGFEHRTPCPLGDGIGSAGPIGSTPQSFYCPHRTHAPDGAR